MTPNEWNECCKTMGMLWPNSEINGTQMDIWKERLMKYKKEEVLAAMKAVYVTGEFPQIAKVVAAIHRYQNAMAVVKREPTDQTESEAVKARMQRENEQWAAISQDDRAARWDQIRRAMPPSVASLHRETRPDSAIARVFILAAIDDPNQQHGGQY
jgi:hypothetical protein